MKMKIDLYQHGDQSRLSSISPNRTYKPTSHANKAAAFTDGDACEPSTGSLIVLRLRMENLRQYGNKNDTDAHSKPVSKWTMITP